MKRLDPEMRRNVIITAALKAAEQFGVAHFNDTQVADLCTVETSVATVRRYFPKYTQLLSAMAGAEGCSDEIKKQLKGLGI